MKDIGTVVRDRDTLNSVKKKTDMPSILYLDVIADDPIQSLTLNGIRRYAAALGLKAVAVPDSESRPAIHEVSDEWRRLARSAVFISLPPKGPLS